MFRFYKKNVSIFPSKLNDQDCDSYGPQGDHKVYFNEKLAKIDSVKITPELRSLINDYRNQIVDANGFKKGFDLMGDAAECGISIGPSEKDLNQLKVNQESLQLMKEEIEKHLDPKRAKLGN